MTRPAPARIARMSARCCSTATGWSSSPAAPTCRMRRAPAGGWQLPQGGIDADEDPRARRAARTGGGDRHRPRRDHRRASGLADLRPAARTAGRRAGRALSRAAAALVRAALHRRRTPISASISTRTRNSTPGAGSSWPNCRRWRWRSSGRSTTYLADGIRPVRPPGLNSAQAASRKQAAPGGGKPELLQGPAPAVGHPAMVDPRRTDDGDPPEDAGRRERDEKRYPQNGREHHRAAAAIPYAGRFRSPAGRSDRGTPSEVERIKTRLELSDAP